MRKFNKIVLVLASAAAISTVAALTYFTPWVKDISIRTTPDAFVGPVIGLGKEVLPPNTIAFEITPAAWPEEAHLISRAARRGKVVHVTVLLEGAEERFDVIGVSPNGNMLASIASMSNKEKIRKMLLVED